MTSIDKKGTHLTEEERNVIEDMLLNGNSIIGIAKTLGRDKTTISGEIKRHRERKEPTSICANTCIHCKECRKGICSKDMDCYDEICPLLKKSPYVCNGCEKKNFCRLVKFFYHSRKAQEAYEDLRSESRSGIRLSYKEEVEIENVIYDLIKEKNQSVNEVYANNPDVLTFSKPTFYKYVNEGLFHLKNHDLRRKVRYKYKAGKKSKTTRKESKIRINRTYKDFLEFISLHPKFNIVEMDTVEGTKGGKVFLTLYFRKNHLMLIYLLNSQTTEEVTKVFNELKSTLGKRLFKRLFRVILTDNGKEFYDPDSIEKINDKQEINLFYCDPHAPYQKAGIEKNHEYIRYVLPKGKTFDFLTQKDVDILMNNINNCVRGKLNNKSPYNVFKEFYKEESLDILKKLNNYYIKPNDVNLSKKLLANHNTNKKIIYKIINELEEYYQKNEEIVFDKKFKLAIINYLIDIIDNFPNDESIYYAAKSAIEKGIISNK